VPKAKSTRTTIAGILAFVSVIIGTVALPLLNNEPIKVNELFQGVGGVAAAFGLIAAADHKNLPEE